MVEANDTAMAWTFLPSGPSFYEIHTRMSEILASGSSTIDIEEVPGLIMDPSYPADALAIVLLVSV